MKVVERMGACPEEIENYQPLTEDGLTIQHNKFMEDALPKIGQMIAAKDFVLPSSPEDRIFYLGDNPVGLQNT